MPYNGLGTFSLTYNWQQDQANGILVRADRMDTQEEDIATGLSTCLLKDGTQTVTANIPMAGFKFTGLGNGSSPQDSTTYIQVFTSANTFTGLKTFSGGLTGTGVVTFSGATSVSVPTATAGDSSTNAASTAFVAGVAMAAALPAQTGNAGAIVTTDGSTASWQTAFAIPELWM